jgi:hypothetical protein
MQNENKKFRPLLLRSAFCILSSAFFLGCTWADQSPRIVQRQATDNDTPFGGGFPASQHPNGDPFNRAGDQTQIRIDSRGDNGAPETRIDGGNPDSRLSR